MTTHQTLKKTRLALGVALAIAAGSATAVDISITPNGSPVSVYLGSASSTFDNFFDFTLGTSATVTGHALSSFYSGATTWGPDVIFKDLQVWKLDGLNWTSLGDFNLNSPQLVQSGWFTAGEYRAELKGDVLFNPGPQAAAYQAWITTAVPEPGEWAMILAGLGMVGVMARRRSQQG